MFFDWSLHSFLVTSYTFYILPVCAAFSASFAKSSVHVRLSLLILFFTSLSFLRYSTYPFFYPFRSYSMHLFLQLFPLIYSLPAFGTDPFLMFSLSWSKNLQRTVIVGGLKCFPLALYFIVCSLLLKDTKSVSQFYPESLCNILWF